MATGRAHPIRPSADGASFLAAQRDHVTVAYLAPGVETWSRWEALAAPEFSVDSAKPEAALRVEYSGVSDTAALDLRLRPWRLRTPSIPPREGPGPPRPGALRNPAGPVLVPLFGLNQDSIQEIWVWFNRRQGRQLNLTTSTLPIANDDRAFVRPSWPGEATLMSWTWVGDRSLSIPFQGHCQVRGNLQSTRGVVLETTREEGWLRL